MINKIVLINHLTRGSILSLHPLNLLGEPVIFESFDRYLTSVPKQSK